MPSIIKSSRKYYNKKTKKSKLKNKRKKYNNSKYKKNMRKKTRRRRRMKGGSGYEYATSNPNEGPVEEVIYYTKSKLPYEQHLYKQTVSSPEINKFANSTEQPLPISILGKPTFKCTIAPNNIKIKIDLKFGDLLKNIFGEREGEELAIKFNDTYNKQTNESVKNKNSIELSRKIDELSTDKILGSGNFGKIYKMENDGEEFVAKLYKVPPDIESVILNGIVGKTPVDPFTYLFILQKTLSGDTILISPKNDNERYEEIINEYKTLEELQRIPGICKTKGLIVLTGDKKLVAGYAMEKLDGLDLEKYNLNHNFELVKVNEDSEVKEGSEVKEDSKVKDLVEFYEPNLKLENFVEQLITIMDKVFEKKYVHNDLYARNIFITNINEVYMIDWGLGRKIGEKYDGGKIPGKNLILSRYSRAEDVFCLAQLIIELINRYIYSKSYEKKNEPVKYPDINLYPQTNIPRPENIKDIKVIKDINLITTKKDELSKKFNSKNPGIKNIKNFVKKILDTDYLINLYKKDNNVGNFNEELPTLKQIFENPEILDKKTTVTP